MYMAPELVKNTEYDEKVDIWAIGILTFILFTGRSPYPLAGKKSKIFDEIRKEKEISFSESELKNVSKAAKDFISKCLARVPSRRPSCDDLLKSSWLKSKEKETPN